MAKKISIELEIKAPQTCVRDFEFKVTAEQLKAESDRVANAFAGMVQIPGFRAGKAPIALVKTKYASEIADELRNRIISAAFDMVGEQKDLDVMTLVFKKPVADIDVNADLEFAFEANVAPEINVGDYKSITVEIPKDAVEESALDERVDFYRSMYGSYAAIEEAAKAEDMLKVDYTSDFVPAEDATASVKRQAAATDSFIWLNEPETMPGVIAALTGAEKGKEYEFASVYPADYREEALAGKTVNYKVTVKDIQRRTKLDDAALLEKLQLKSMDELRDRLREAMESDNEGARRSKAADAVYSRLDEMAGEFELPPALLAEETNKEIQKMAREQVKSEEDANKFKEELDAKRAEAETAAKAALRRTLILRKVAKLEEVTVEDAELDAQLAMMSYQYGYKAKELKDMMEKNGAIEEFRIDMTNAKTLDKLVGMALK
ncbi:MAG: trigger factor [Lentisphaerae bacterium]|nr:trigger factor [Lentisphaerota bacterium]